MRKTANQFQQSPVLHFPCDPDHEDVVLDPIEEFREVHINALAIAGSDITLYLFGCVLSGTFRSKSKARFGEARIEDWGQDL